MTDYHAGTLAALVQWVDAPAPNTTAKGRRLQCLAEWLVGQVDGTVVSARNKLDAAHSQETDLWLNHLPHLSLLPFRDLDVPIECKNEATPTSAQQVREFAAKIHDSGGTDGLLITRMGLAGTPGDSAHEAIKMALHDRCCIIVVRRDDLVDLASTDHLVRLLRERLTELRQEHTYTGI